MVWVEFNTNIDVKARLSWYGKEVLKNYFSKYTDMEYEECPGVKEKGDVFEGPLWKFFEIFGPSILVTSPSPFHKNVVSIDLCKLKAVD